MRTRPHIGAIVVGLLSTVGCGQGDSGYAEPGRWRIGEIREVKGTIRSLDEVSSGCWGLDIGDRNLEMVKLDSRYRVDGFSVVAAVRVEGEYTSICGIGQMVSIIDIRER